MLQAINLLSSSTRTVAFLDAEWAAEQFADAICGVNGLGDTITSLVAADSETGATGVTAKVQAGLTSAASNVTSSMQAVALAIAMLFFLIALLELSTSERLTLEFFIKFFSKLAISIFLIYMIPTIITTVVQFGGALATEYNNAKLVDATTEKDLRDTIEKSVMDMYNAGSVAKWPLIITALLYCGMLKLVGLALSVIAYIVCVSRLLEMTVRGCFLPIAVALISDDGWRGAGGRYIRKYIAICSQGAVLVMVGKLTNYVMGIAATQIFATTTGGGGTIGDILSNCAIFLAIAIASVSLMFKSIGIVNDAFGA